MEKEKLIELINENLSIRKIGQRSELSPSSVRYWLRKYGLKTKIKRYRTIPDEYTGKCRLCGNALSENRRRRCGSCNTRIRRYRSKLKAVEMMGGCCQSCGWKGTPAGFDFHHTQEKDFGIGIVCNKSWSTIETELKKCILLCKICHAILHSKHEDEELIKELERYAKTV